MKRSSERILTTHAGSLPRPEDLLDLLWAREDGVAGADERFLARLPAAVAEAVRLQADAGVDVPSDGELGKPSFVHYVRSRIAGFEVTGEQSAVIRPDPDFPGYAAWRNANRPAATRLPFSTRTACVGPLTLKGNAELEQEIADFKAALAQAGVTEAFLPCASIGIVAQRIENRYYPTYEKYVEAIAEVMKEEYRAIAGAGLLIQIDAPEMCIDRNRPEFVDKPISAFQKRAELWVEALNHALEGIPAEQVRYHICWGNNEAPHNHDISLTDIVEVMLKVNAAAYSVEASNPRHGHEWKVWQDVKLPDGKVLIPGVIDSVTNFVEHPELVADRILTYARIVGRENVIAGTDCGFGTSAGSANVYPPVVWAKLKALAEGAALASKELWRPA
jgi:5-methyltetrahydropteroyltriglutamate--homocysteine methyltransferase